MTLGECLQAVGVESQAAPLAHDWTPDDLLVEDTPEARDAVWQYGYLFKPVERNGRRALWVPFGNWRGDEADGYERRRALLPGTYYPAEE